jgi:hypothetical protein
MNFTKILARLGKVFALALSILLFISSMPAMATVIPIPFPLTATVKNGNFSVSPKQAKNPLPAGKLVVRRAILILPDGEFGTIKSIKITGERQDDSTVQNLFGCSNINVRNGIDLIKACGGPAELLGIDKLKDLRYQAEGTGFGPNPNIKFEVVLFDDFGTEV